MSDCEWRYDVAGGELLNFWKWSDTLSFEAGREAMQKETEKGSSAPVLVNVPPGLSSKAQCFTTPQDALNYFIVIDPWYVGDLREKANLAQQQVTEQEDILVRWQEAEKVARAKLDDVQAKLNGEGVPKVLDWMYGDPKTLAFLKPISRFNPLRWRTAHGGPATFPTAIAEFEELANSAANEGQPQRPVILKIPPGLRTPEQRFDNFDAAIEFLRKDAGNADTVLAKAQEEYEHAKAHVTDAQEQLDTAKKFAEEAKAAFTAAEEVEAAAL